MSVRDWAAALLCVALGSLLGYLFSHPEARPAWTISHGVTL